MTIFDGFLAHVPLRSRPDLKDRIHIYNTVYLRWSILPYDRSCMNFKTPQGMTPTTSECQAH